MFENYKVFKYTLAGRPLVIETGKLAGLANGSCLVRYGETVVLACATASEKPRDGIDFLPLSVDFEERMYAAGKIPGGFLRREGRPGEKAILTSRVIDRPIRPLFPKDLRNDVAISLTVMAVDPDCSHEIAGMIGASIALSISDIPWNGPIGGVFVGMVDGKPVINPTKAQRDVSTLELTVAATMQKIVMIEAGAKEVSDDDMYNAIMLAHEEIKGLLGFINGIVAEIGKPKFAYPSCELDHDMFDEVFAFCEKDLMTALDTDDKNVRDERMVPIQDAIIEHFSEKYPDIASIMGELVYKMQKKIVRRWLLEDASAWTADVSTRSVRWQPRSVSFTACTAAVCSPAVRRRCSRSQPSARWTTSRSWTASTTRPRSATCTTTTCPVIPPVRQSPQEAPDAARSVTVRLPSVRSSRFSPLWRNSPMPSAAYPKSSPPTVRPRRHPSAARRWR